MRCNHCANAPCVEVCPVTALYTRDDGIVDFDKDRCIGCKACTQACPYDALYIDPLSNTASKCNYCTHRVDNGLEPACVVVCPEHAIISGDMDDDTTEISQLLAENTVVARKTEKGTAPKLFYIEADEISLEPVATNRESGYMWSSQERGVGHNVAKDPSPSEKFDNSAARTYDAPDKGVLWGWEVAAYLVTKGIAGGAVLISIVLYWLGKGRQDMVLVSLFVGLVFLTITGALLVKDLDRPDRFLSVLLRPQWRSWIVRGAYIITVFGGLMSAWMLGYYMGWMGSLTVLNYLIFPFAFLTVVYTAFLFAQAKGRDYWQNKMLPFHMFLHSIMVGGSAMLVLSYIMALEGVYWVRFVLLCSTFAHLLYSVYEALHKESNRDARLASKMIHQGIFKNQFWLGVVLLGNILPIALLFVNVSYMDLGAAVLVIIGTWIANHILVKAPQLIPLS